MEGLRIVIVVQEQFERAWCWVLRKVTRLVASDIIELETSSARQDNNESPALQGCQCQV